MVRKRLDGVVSVDRAPERHSDVVDRPELDFTLHLGKGIDTNPETVIEASACRSVDVFTLSLAGESGYQARRGSAATTHSHLDVQ